MLFIPEYFTSYVLYTGKCKNTPVVCQGLVLVYGKCSEFTGKELVFMYSKIKLVIEGVIMKLSYFIFFETGILSNQG